jgi:predicted nucleic acid-binding protein
LIAIVDTGPLFAAADVDDANHDAALAVLERTDLDLVIPSLVVAETACLLQSRLGPRVEARFLRGLSTLDVEAPHPDDWIRIADLVERYADFPLGGADASVIALAERLGTELVITLDRRHFGAVRPRHCEALQLLP